MELNETVEMMNSTNHKERFKAEYYQLKIRMTNLEKFLEKYRNGKLDFQPNCSYDLLHGQYKAMDLYLTYLEERAEIENVDLK